MGHNEGPSGNPPRRTGSETHGSSMNSPQLGNAHVNDLPPHPSDTSSQPSFFQNLFRSNSSPMRDEENDKPIPQDPTEESPLLGAGDGARHRHMSDAFAASSVIDGHIHVTWQQETKIIVTYAIPLIITFLLQYSITATSVFVLGRLGPIELGAASLANMSASISCLTPFQGLATSLDTLCSQAYGSGKNHLVGLHCQRLTLFLMCLAFPIAILWIFAEQIFLQILPDPQTAQLAGAYLRVMIFGIPGIIFFETGKRFLSTQCLFRATTYLLLIAAPINIFLHWLFVFVFEWGFIGAPIAAVLTTDLIPVLLFLYVVFVDGKKCWGGLSKKALNNWPTMLRMALPAMFMLEAEWLAFELMTFLASSFGTDYLAAQSILATLTSIAYQIPFPLSIASSTRIAHLIGAGEIGPAKKTAKVAFGATFTVAIINFCIFAFLRNQLPLAFTDDQATIELTAGYLPLVAVVQIFDGLGSGAHGLLRGIGKQYIGGPVNLIAYYVIAMPIVLGLVFGLGWKLDGMWLGIAIGLISVSIFEYTYVLHANWDKAAKEAEVRNAAG